MSNASSPCIGVCTLDQARALCLGCGRRLDEIAGWSGMSQPQRLAIMADLPGRLARTDRSRSLTSPPGIPS
jgi:predicted Fe-S protein YdhL (DUF1289 family)